ncbi:MAG: iron-sulfur cluster assembly scaffold protein, partial [Sneathiella sp.]
IALDGDIITDYAHELRACAIGQAVASVVAEVIVGLTVAEVEEGAEVLEAVLKERKPPPPGPWIGLEPFLPVADFRNRHSSALLPFQALQRAIGEGEMKRKGHSGK